MKNLSKALSLMLSSALAFTMVAGAAEFTDISDVKNSDAVKTMSSLGVIKGYPDGTFKPEGTVTRAEMAKMIYVYMNGGVDDGAVYFKGTSVSKLTDISGHWAEGYIKYCESMNIIAGRGDGKFYPEDTVTGLEAAKMLLVVQGYNDPVKAGLVGSNWALKTQTLGSRSELFRNYGVDLSQGCPRQYAALMMYNSLDATYMTWDNDLGDYVKSTKTADTVTLGERYLNLVTVEGVLEAAGDVALGGTAGSDKVSILVEKENDKTLTATTTPAKGSVTYNTEDDSVYEFLGQYVRASVNKRDNSIIGLFKVDSKNTVVDTTVSKVQLVTNEENKIKIDGTEYKVEDMAAGTAGTQNDVIVFGAGTDGNNISTTGAVTIMGIGALKDSDWRTVFNGTVSNALANASAVKFIDNDADGKFEYIVITPVSAVAKVTNVSSTTFSANGTYNFKDVTVNGEVKKDDYVVRTYNAFESKYVFEILKSFEGEVTAIKDNGASAKIDGKWYKLEATGSSKLNDFSATSFTAGSTYKLYAIGDVVYAGQKIAAGSTDIAIVKSTLGATKGSAGEYKVTLYFPNDKTSAQKEVIVKSYVDNKLSALSGDKLAGQPDEGALVTYEKSSDYADMYDIYYVGDFDKDGEKIDAGYETIKVAQAGGFKASSDTLGKSVSIDDDALVIFAYSEDGSKKTDIRDLKFDVKTGKELKDLNDDFGDSYSYLTNDKDFGNAELVFIYDKDATLTIGVKDKVLGFVTERAKDSKNTTLTIWDGSKTSEITVSGSSATYNKFPVGSPVYMNEITGSTYEKEDVVNIQTQYNNKAANYGLGAVTASNSKSVRLYDVRANAFKTFNITEDTVILSVDTDAQVGNNDGMTDAIKVSDVTKLSDYTDVQRVTIDDVQYFANAYYVVDSNDLLYIVVDSKGAWHGSKTAADIAVTAAAEEATTIANGVATITDSYNVSALEIKDISGTEINLSKDKVLTVDKDLTIEKLNTSNLGTITVKSGATLTVSDDATETALAKITLEDGATVAFKSANTYVDSTQLIAVVGRATTVGATGKFATDVEVDATLTVNADLSAESETVNLTIGTNGKVELSAGDLRKLKVTSLKIDGKTVNSESASSLATALNSDDFKAFTAANTKNSEITVNGTTVYYNSDTSVWADSTVA